MCLGHVETTHTADMGTTVSIMGWLFVTCGNQKHSRECEAWWTCRSRDYPGG